MTRTTAIKKPHNGASATPRAVLITPDQTTASSPTWAMPAPSRPPISACELLVDAWAVYQRGLWRVGKATSDDVALAEKFFQRAIAATATPTFDKKLGRYVCRPK
jgi:hypothetical protein